MNSIRIIINVLPTSDIPILISNAENTHKIDVGTYFFKNVLSVGSKNSQIVRDARYRATPRKISFISLLGSLISSAISLRNKVEFFVKRYSCKIKTKPVKNTLHNLHTVTKTFCKKKKSINISILSIASLKMQSSLQTLKLLYFP